MATSKHTTSTLRPKRDLSGQTFHQLVVQRYLGQSRWECLCVCGKATTVHTTHLRSGHTRSCGCLKRTHALSNTFGVIHRLSFHPIYRRWRGMLNRCYNPAHEHFYLYGGRGITVCERWRHSVVNFHADMGDPPPGLTLDRIDTNKNYEPGNCRWATATQQQRNRRSNRLLTYNGETHPISAWAEMLHVEASMLRARIRNGWGVEETLTTPRRSHLLTYNGETHHITVWAEKLQVEASMLRARREKGWSVEDTLTIPPRYSRKRRGGA